MTPTKGQRSIKEVGSSSQAPSRPQRTTWASTNARAQGNIPHPLSLTNRDHVARYNCLNERMVVVIWYYDEELLARLGMLDDIRWLFARDSVGHYIEIKEHTYRNLTLEFLGTLHIEVTRGPQCQARYISFYLQGQLYELNLGTFNIIFDFSPCMDLLNWRVPREFIPNPFWGELSGSVRYNTSSSKCTHIRNPCIRVAQRIQAYCFFARDDSLNVSRLSELYFLSCMLSSVQLGPGSF